MTKANNKNPFQETLNLPKTDFSLRAHAATKEPELLDRWEKNNLAHAATIHNKGKKKFILHDGPPYANGHLHMGHALTYVLKDMVCKTKRMEGFHAPLVPGWDCHGLPIELKVTKEKSLEKSRESIDPVVFKKYCREYVNHWIEVQKKELKELGKLADYENAYMTMNPEYEASILEALAVFVERGYIERKLKTVLWCGSCQTVLAAAEIEYKDRQDPSTYILFQYPDESAQLTFSMLFEKNPDLKINFLIWTTTPWTIPLNRAVVLNPKAEYVVLQGRDEDEAFVVVKELGKKTCETVGIDYIELATCDSVVFEGKKAQHPLVDDLQVPVLLDDTVLTGEGTGCLHSAPGCGPEDYLLGKKHGLDIYSPLSPDGKYTSDINITTLAGKTIQEGNSWVMKTLIETNRMFHKASIKHSYPHCWRCKNGLMFRATDQWFCDLQKNDLVKKALGEIEKISFVPAWGQDRLHAFTSGRTEWCISRQRQWGVPIPAILDTKNERAFLSADLIRNVASHVAKDGIEFWDTMTVEKLIELKLVLPVDLEKHFGHSDFENMKLERDILDVWFDSGVSHYAVLSKDSDLGEPADMYLEGSDQHRGWFQSSLLTGVVLNDKAPMKEIVTHGYVVDENKHKMSKSVGNVIAPSEVMQQYSRDVLRLWVASTDYEGDVVISQQLLKNVFEMYRKIRNTCRFLVSNIYDFDVSKDAIDITKLKAIDQYALSKLYDLSSKVRDAYGQYKFVTAVQLINNYCVTDLSSTYLDILKDRLYVEKADSYERRSGQTVLYHILDVLCRLMAPVLSFLAEELSDHYQKDKQNSIHLQNFAREFDVTGSVSGRPGIDYLQDIERSRVVQSSALDAKKQLKIGQWTMLEILRDAVLKAIEVKRAAGNIKHSYEAQISIALDPTSNEASLMKSFINELKHKEDVTRFLKDWFIVSGVTISDSGNGLEPSQADWAFVGVSRAKGDKCPRCWQWSVTEHADKLCLRCQDVLR